MDSWPRSVPQRRAWPSPEVPARRTEQHFSAADRANARTDKRTPRHCSSSECGSAAAPGLENPPHPSAGRIPPQADTRVCSSNLQWAEFRSDQFVGLSPVQLVDAIQAAAKISEDSVLYLTAALGRGVWNTMKRHHGILGHKDLRILGLQRQFDFLAEKKTGIANAISHLDEVFYGHVGDGVGVCLASQFEVAEDTLPVGCVDLNQFQQNRAVLKSAVDPLPEERHDGMGSISQQKRVTFGVPR